MSAIIHGRNPFWAPEYTGMKPAFNDMGCWRLNKDNLQNQGLEVLDAVNAGAGAQSYNLARNNNGALSGSTWTIGSEGRAININGSAQRVVYALPASITTTSQWSLVIRARFIGTPALKNMFSIQDASGNNIAICYWWTAASGNILVQKLASGVSRTTKTGATIDITQWHTWGFHSNGSADRVRIFCDGIDVSSDGAAALSAGSVKGVCIGQGADTYNPTMDYSRMALYSYNLPASLIIMAHTSPFGTPSDPRFLWEPSITYFVPITVTVGGLLPKVYPVNPIRPLSGARPA